MNQKLPKKASILLFFLLAGVFVFFTPNVAKAIPGYYPFGGTVLYWTPCTCQYFPGAEITVNNDPKGGTFLYYAFASIPYMYYQFLIPGRRVLGLALAKAPCLQTAGYACTISDWKPYIFRIGSNSQ
jgi:hypothetical protein